jgi:hypothetical protein
VGKRDARPGADGRADYGAVQQRIIPLRIRLALAECQRSEDCNRQQETARSG